MRGEGSCRCRKIHVPHGRLGTLGESKSKSHEVSSSVMSRTNDGGSHRVGSGRLVSSPKPAPSPSLHLDSVQMCSDINRQSRRCTSGGSQEQVVLWLRESMWGRTFVIFGPRFQICFQFLFRLNFRSKIPGHRVRRVQQWYTGFANAWFLAWGTERGEERVCVSEFSPNLWAD